MDLFRVQIDLFWVKHDILGPICLQKWKISRKHNQKRMILGFQGHFFLAHQNDNILRMGWTYFWSQWTYFVVQMDLCTVQMDLFLVQNDSLAPIWLKKWNISRIHIIKDDTRFPEHQDLNNSRIVLGPKWYFGPILLKKWKVCRIPSRNRCCLVFRAIFPNPSRWKEFKNCLDLLRVQNYILCRIWLKKWKISRKFDQRWIILGLCQFFKLFEKEILLEFSNLF